ncbi:uncharacterized protein LOC121340654 [Onychostruthus taczanowskii]|uniref:uncharacterized protein LOC121340654 n=1 Tax=Onychostruthus taczanowskii TaxID=356909 RepID=UPI001B80E014|nr:uncharacterized protein LOC121340654 [Onychostruthus taczanowskii]
MDPHLNNMREGRLEKLICKKHAQGTDYKEKTKCTVALGAQRVLLVVLREPVTASSSTFPDCPTLTKKQGRGGVVGPSHAAPWTQNHSYTGCTGLLIQFNSLPCTGHPQESHRVPGSVVQSLLELCQASWCDHCPGEPPPGPKPPCPNIHLKPALTQLQAIPRPVPMWPRPAPGRAQEQPLPVPPPRSAAVRGRARDALRHPSQCLCVSACLSVCPREREGAGGCALPGGGGARCSASPAPGRSRRTRPGRGARPQRPA